MNCHIAAGLPRQGCECYAIAAEAATRSCTRCASAPRRHGTGTTPNRRASESLYPSRCRLPSARWALTTRTANISWCSTYCKCLSGGVGRWVQGDCGSDPPAVVREREQRADPHRDQQEDVDEPVEQEHQEAVR